MKARLMFASLFTLAVLFGFVATVVLIALYYLGMISAPLLLGLTVVFNILFWLISPFIQDLVLKWFYACETVEWPEFQNRWPALAESIQMTCTKHKIPIPKMRIIDDGNPTAYCFGSGPWNARLVATRGLFQYLDTDEVTAVYFHELGHIVNRDFIVMTIAATLLTMLYEAYAILSKTRGKGGNDIRNRLVWLGYVSYIFYVIGSYMVLYLSRTREYLADRFAAEETRNPNWLALGLVKVAYGIVAAPDTDKSKRLLASTRALGLYDYKAADATGSAYARIATATGGGGVAVAAPVTGSSSPATLAPERVERVFLFDLFNPWAKIGELNSTHPLTGKRIQKLMEYCQEFNVGPRFDFSLVSYEGQMIDRARMRQKFLLEVCVYFAPAIGFLLGVLAPLTVQTGPSLLAPLLGLGLGWSLQGMYSFPGGTAERTTVFELMCDPYASPVRGRLVLLEGKVVGRASAGSPVGEDMILQDRSGCLIALNYESWFPVFGNLLFGWRRVKNLMGETVSALGWFRRYTSSQVDLNQMKAFSGNIESYTRFWGVWRGPAAIALALLLMFVVRSV